VSSGCDAVTCELVACITVDPARYSASAVAGPSDGRTVPSTHKSGECTGNGRLNRPLTSIGAPKGMQVMINLPRCAHYASLWHRAQTWTDPRTGASTRLRSRETSTAWGRSRARRWRRSGYASGSGGWAHTERNWTGWVGRLAYRRVTSLDFDPFPALCVSLYTALSCTFVRRVDGACQVCILLLARPAFQRSSISLVSAYVL